MKAAEVKKILTYLGFHFDRARGSHYIYKKTGMTGMPPTVPSHAGDIGDQDLRSIWKQAKVSEIFRCVKGNVQNYLDALDEFALGHGIDVKDIGLESANSAPNAGARRLAA